MNMLQQFNESVVETLDNSLPMVLGAIIVLAASWLIARLLKSPDAFPRTRWIRSLRLSSDRTRVAPVISNARIL